MDHIKDTFERMNVRQIRSFLLYGTDSYDEATPLCRETLNRTCDPIYKRLETLYPDVTELDQTVADLTRALTAYEYVYMELGMKAGARLIQKLLTAE